MALFEIIENFDPEDNEENDDGTISEEEELDFSMSSSDMKNKIREEKKRLRENEEESPDFFTTNFGPWEFDLDERMLVHQEQQYDIPLDGINSSASILDWIMQIGSKPWATSLDVSSLVHAFSCILHPQQHYCSFEENMRASGKQLAETYAEKVREVQEERERIDRLQAQAQEVLVLVSSYGEKPYPLSLLVESITSPVKDLMVTLRILEKLHLIHVDYATKYISLTTTIVSAIDENLNAPV